MKRHTTGPASAALIAAGSGCLLFGLITLFSAHYAPFEKWLTWSEAVGALSGKSSLAVGVWPVLWAVLHVFMRKKEVPLFFALTYSLLAIALGVLLTIPHLFWGA